MAVLTLGLGIGATSAIFSLAHAIWLKPLPYASPERLVVLSSVNAASGSMSYNSAPDLEDLLRASPSLMDVALYSYGAQRARVDDEPIRIVANPVSANLFRVLGVRPAIGRDFDPADAGAPVLIMSDTTWRRRFGADPAVLGRSFRLGDTSYVIIGIMPVGFRFPQSLSSEVWIPSNPKLWTVRDDRFLRSVGRLAPGASIDDANRELKAAAAGLASVYPSTNKGWTARASEVDRRATAGYREAFGSLLGIVGLFLVIACANLASLLLTRDAERRGELAVCASLGAGRWRLVRQALLESGLLAAAGSILGIFVAAFGSRLLGTYMPSYLPGLVDVHLSVPVIVFACAASFFTAIASGALPALARRSISASETVTGDRAAGSRSPQMSSALIVLQVALAVLLMVGAALMAKKFAAQLGMNRGFDPRDVAALNVTLPFDRVQYGTAASRSAALQAVIDHAARVPGVRLAAATNGFPGSALGSLGGDGIRATGAATAGTSAIFHSASQQYFAAIGARLSAGRVFDDRDNRTTARVAVITESLAKRLWPSSPAIGERLLLPSIAGLTTAGESWEIVGVVADIRIDQRPSSDVFLPLAATPAFWIDLVIRTDGNPAVALQSVRASLRALNRDLLLENASSIDAIISDSLGLERAQTVFAATTAVLATAVSGVGLYALLSAAVTRRRREIGIRLALGSTPAGLFRSILRRGLGLAVVGAAIGMAATALLVQSLQHRLFGLADASPTAYIAAATAMVIVAGAATWIPARRAMQIAPLTAMRH